MASVSTKSRDKQTVISLSLSRILAEGCQVLSKHILFLPSMVLASHINIYCLDKMCALLEVKLCLPKVCLPVQFPVARARFGLPGRQGRASQVWKTIEDSKNTDSAQDLSNKMSGRDLHIRHGYGINHLSYQRRLIKSFSSFVFILLIQDLNKISLNVFKIYRLVFVLVKVKCFMK